MMENQGLCCNGVQCTILEIVELSIKGWYIKMYDMEGKCVMDTGGRGINACSFQNMHEYYSSTSLIKIIQVGMEDAFGYDVDGG